jgi:chromosome partitioning protein
MLNQTTADSLMQPSQVSPSLDDLIAENAKVLSSQLHTLRARLFPPTATKQLRPFTSAEAARLIGVSDGYLRQISLAGDGPTAERGPGGKRLFTLSQIHEVRRRLGRTKPSYLPTRINDQHLQILAVTNFKGGSGKTTVSTHLAQYLGLRGFRVLAIDLDPQASMTALFGYQPEFDIKDNETLYGAIRYDDSRRPLAEIIRPTYFDGLELIPANLELHEFEHDTPKMLADSRQRGGLFFLRIAQALSEVDANYDVVIIDCPPQLGFLTLSAITAATGTIVTIHPQMLDIASMSQFLHMSAGLLSVVRQAGGKLQYDFLRYLVTRYEPNDGPQNQIVGFLRSLFGDLVLTHPMVKSTAVAEAGLRKQTVYEVSRDQIHRQTYDRAIESLDAVNGEIEDLIKASWGRAVA